MAGAWRARVLWAAAALLLLAGVTTGVRRWGPGGAVRSVAGPAAGGCAARPSGTATFAAAQPEPVTAARQWTRLVSATAAPAAIVVSESDVAEEDAPHWPARIVGLDPATLAQRWEWAYPAGAGADGHPVGFSYSAQPGGSSDSWLLVDGDVALVVGADHGPRLIALDVASGSQRWSLPLAPGTTPIVLHADACLIVVNLASYADGNPNGTLGLVGLNRADGTVVWRDSAAAELICLHADPPWLYGVSSGHLLRYALTTGQVAAIALDGTTSDGCDLQATAADRLFAFRTGHWFTADWAALRITPAGRRSPRPTGRPRVS